MIQNQQGDLVPAPRLEYFKLNTFIQQERCCANSEGICSSATVVQPWGSYTDARLSRVFPAAQGRSLELSLDVFNFLHHIDPDWGLIHGADDTPLLELMGYDATTGHGLYRRLERRPG